VNEELRRMFADDQADRESIGEDTPPEQWERVRQRDEARLARCKELIAAGALQTGKDYWLLKKSVPSVRQSLTCHAKPLNSRAC